MVKSTTYDVLNIDEEKKIFNVEENLSATWLDEEDSKKFEDTHGKQENGYIRKCDSVTGKSNSFGKIS